MPTGLPLFDAANPSPVHPPEIKSDSDTLVDGGLGESSRGLAETFRHSGWRRHRGLVHDALRRTMQSVSRIVAFADCGYSAFVYRTVDPPHRYRLAGSSCHDKFCTPCAKDRSHIIANNVTKHLDGKSVRFLTLTVKHNAETLGRQLDRLYQCFARLRQNRIWKSHVIGGAAFLEIKWIEASESWHPHLHIVIEGKYWDQRTLAAAWFRITGDSHVIDIRAIKNEAKIAHYVAKYTAKSVNDTFINRPDRLDEAIVALHRRRLCLTFGTWRGLKLSDSPSERDWESLGSFHCVCLQALQGETESMVAVEQICGHRMATVLAAVQAAIPPPFETKKADRQLFFQFCPDTSAMLR